MPAIPNPRPELSFPLHAPLRKVYAKEIMGNQPTKSIMVNCGLNSREAFW